MNHSLNIPSLTIRKKWSNFIFYPRIYIDLPGIGELPENAIQSRFLERSVEIKIHGYNGKNYIFAVPKTQCMIKVDESKVIQKKDKIIISLGKLVDADNWHSLHKVKGVGEKDVDWCLYIKSRIIFILWNLMIWF